MFNDDNFYADKISCKILSVLVFVLIVALLWLMSTDSANGGEQKWRSYYLDVLATSYCLCEKCTGKAVHDGKTASGKNAFKVGVATDPKVIPTGSRVDIPGMKPWLLCDDVGGAIKDEHIDIRVPRVDGHKEALSYGTKYIRIRVWVKE